MWGGGRAEGEGENPKLSGTELRALGRTLSQDQELITWTEEAKPTEPPKRPWSVFFLVQGRYFSYGRLASCFWGDKRVSVSLHRFFLN